MQTINDAARPRLAPHVRMVFNSARGEYALLSPETVWAINPTGAAIVELCDSGRTVGEIVSELRSQYQHVTDEDVKGFVAELVTKHGMEMDHG